MPKRKRSSGVELIKSDDNGMVIEYNQKEYYVCGSEYLKLFENSDVEIEIVHNCENRAMLKIENIRSGEIVVQQEINPLKFKNSEEWVSDD